MGEVEDANEVEIVYSFVKTTNGCVRGRRRMTIYGDNYYSYERIPYGQPPIGRLRFKAPVPRKSWTKTLDCTKKPKKPMQHNFLLNITEGSEDCLYLNIYVQKFNTETLLPVMVYFYGGGFEKGDPTSDRHGPDYFMMKPIVLVTISYRFGALGFLSLNDPQLDCPGNAGLKDQLLALKWLKANARNFNGDADNITAFGCSAGAASTHFLSLTPLAEGLFHKMILQSGVALCPWAINTLKCLPHRLAFALGYKGPWTEAEVLNFLRKADAKELVKQYILTPEENVRGHLFNFGPVIEPYKSEHCILPYAPEVLFTKAWGNSIPMLIGATSFEGLVMRMRLKQRPFVLDAFENHKQLLLPQTLMDRSSVKKRNQLAEIVKKMHFGDKPINADILTFCEYASYKIFWHPIHRTLMARQWYATAPTYLYRFDFDSPFFNLYRIKFCGKDVCGVTHCDDLSYLFHCVDSFKLDKQTMEYLTIKRMISIWTTFAKTSNPNCKKYTQCNWLPLECDENEPIRCLNISEKLKFIELPEWKKLKVWKSLYKESYDYDEDEHVSFK